MKWFILGIFIIITIAAISDANADDPHGVVIQPDNVPRGTIKTSQAMALAVSEINPTLLSSKYQVGVGFGSHNDETAIAVGLAKRVNKNLLFSGKIGLQDGSTGTSIGLNFKF